MELNKKEIEKKFLIRYPSDEVLSLIDEGKRSRIVQTYLLSEEGITSRVRMREYFNGVKYTKTEKKRISFVSCFEDERTLTEAEYKKELEKADPKRNPIVKERLLLDFDGHTFEIDLYPFWDDRAIMEIELSAEDEAFENPPSIEVIKDVTEDKRYKNARLAIEIPYDEI